MQKGKVVEEALQIAEKRRAAKCKEEKKMQKGKTVV